MEPHTTVLCTYRVRADQEQDFLTTLRGHWPKMHELGLATAEPAQIFRGLDPKDRPYGVEIWTWTSPEAVERAHTHPEVLALWGPLEALCESRDGLPGCEFPHVERLV